MDLLNCRIFHRTIVRGAIVLGTIAIESGVEIGVGRCVERCVVRADRVIAARNRFDNSRDLHEAFVVAHGNQPHALRVAADERDLDRPACEPAFPGR